MTDRQKRVVEDSKTLWCVEANVIQTRLWGEGEDHKKERRNGVRLYRGGAKVYIIGSYNGMCDSVVVIGHHRKSVKLICSVLRVKFLENFRYRPIYKPSVRKMAQQKVGKVSGAYICIDCKSAMRDLEKVLPYWKRDTNGLVQTELPKPDRNSPWWQFWK